MNFLKGAVFRFLTVFFTVAAVFITAEIFCVAFYWTQDGRWTSVAEKIKNDPDLQFDELQQERAKHRFKKAYVFPRPYLGYTFHSLPPYGTESINSDGFYGPEHPFERDPGTFNLVISGGSVAMQFYRDGTAQKLEEELNAHYTNEHARRFVVRSAALDGWRQPQEFIFLSRNSRWIDGFITLEGWNEGRAIYQRNSKMVLESPDPVYYLALVSHFGKSIANWAYRFDSAIKKWQQHSFLFRGSHFVYFLSQRLRNYFRSKVANEEYSYFGADWEYAQKSLRLPDSWPEEKRTQFILQSYKKYIRMSQLVAAEEGIKTLFLIQPAAVYGKVLTEKEKIKVGHHESREAFVHMHEELLTLREEDIPIYSFLNAFEPYPESELYRDVVHLYPQANQILMKKMLELIEKNWGLKRHG